MATHEFARPAEFEEQLRREHVSLSHKTISALNGDKDNLAYTGNVETGILGVWGNTAFAL